MKKGNQGPNEQQPHSHSGYAETHGKSKGSKKVKQQPENVEKTPDKKEEAK